MKPVSNAGGLDCFHVLALLSDYLEGDLSDADKARVRAHVSACGVCESFGGVFAAAIGTLRQDAAPPELDADIAGRLWQRLKQDQ